LEFRRVLFRSEYDVVTSTRDMYSGRRPEHGPEEWHETVENGAVSLLIHSGCLRPSAFGNQDQRGTLGYAPKRYRTWVYLEILDTMRRDEIAPFFHSGNSLR